MNPIAPRGTRVPRYVPRHLKQRPDGKFGYFLLAILVFTADQMSKDAVLSSMRLNESIPVIPDFFHLTFILNTGASFGVLQSKPGLFMVIIPLILALIMFVVFFSKRISGFVRLMLGVITGGALGNLADRIQYGAVIDFLDFRGVWRYVFNIADMAVVCGSIILAVIFLFEEWAPIRDKARH